MKKRFFLFSALVIVIMCMLAISVGAATTITDDETDNLTLGACTIAGLDDVTIPAPTVGLAYTLDDATMTASVSGRGSFLNGELVIPSSVTYGGNTYDVTKIESGIFNSGNGTRRSYNLYVPDSVTFIAGGPNSGAFGNSTITKVYIGSGLTSIEQETFSGSNGFEVFVCKSKPTIIGKHAFNQNTPSSNGMSRMELDLSNVTRFEELAFNGATILSNCNLEFGENLEYVGNSAFYSSKANGSIIIPEGCTLSYRCFNGTSFERVVIKVGANETKSLPQELFSGASGGLTLIITGPAIAGGDHIFSGNTTSVYMPSYEMIEDLVVSASTKSGNERIPANTYYSCEDGKKYSATKAGVITEIGDAETHIYTEEIIHSPADCTNYERDAYICYVCGDEQVVSQGNVLSKHIFKVTTKAPSCQSSGYSEYICTVCGHKESAHFTGKTEHNPSVISYEIKENAIITITKRCEYCNEIVEVEDISLVNKCYIEGYGLFDATMEYVSVSSDGVATPSSATFNNAVIFFPSYVEINGEIVEVKTVQGFKKYSIKGIYIPDTVTRIAGGSGSGCFGDIGTLKNIVVGKGVDTLEQEVFCIGNGATLDEFIFKNTIKSLGTFCLLQVKASSADMPYEFNTALEYVGQKVNTGGTILREARLVKGCDLSSKFAFNDANGLLSVYIEGGDTPDTALDIGQEFASNTKTQYYYVKGYITVSGRAALSGTSNSRVYMQNKAAIVLFTNAMKQYSYPDRMNTAVFMDCETKTAWYVTDSTEIVEHSTVAFSHGVCTIQTESTCAQAGTKTTYCYVCDTVISTSEAELEDHIFDGGKITKMPTNEEYGQILYSCLGCGKTQTEQIEKLSTDHICIVSIYYENGYASIGTQNAMCPDCNYTENATLEPLFTVLGYSVSEDKTGITSGYKINLEVLEYYERVAGKLDFGFIVADASDASSKGLIDEGGSLVDGVRGCKLAISSRAYSYIDVKLVGVSTDTQRATDFILAVYVTAQNDETKEFSFVQHSLKNADNKPIVAGKYTLNTVSVNRAFEE